MKQRASFTEVGGGRARLGVAAGDSRDHHGRHPDRLVHADRGRHDRRRLHPDRPDPGVAPATTSTSCRATSCTRACSIRCRSRRSPVRPRSAGWWRTCAAPTSSPSYITSFAGTNGVDDHAAAGRAVHHRRRFHRCHPGDHHLHADHHQADAGRPHQPVAHGRGDHHDAGLRSDHAALRAVAAGRIEIRRRRLRPGDGRARCRSTSSSSRRSPSAMLLPDVVLWLPKTLLPGIGRLLQEPDRRPATSVRTDF